MKQTFIKLLAVFALVYLLPLNFRQLSVPDEMRYGEIAREMLDSGDFIVPRLNGLRYFEKPAGGHALNALAMGIFGETNFAVRLMSALATGLGAFALFLLMKRERGPQMAALGAFLFMTCGEIMGVGTFSVLDSMVTGFITLTLCSLYTALNTTGKKKLALLALTGVFAGCAFLVKGFIALAVPVVVTVPYLLIRRQWKQLFVLPWIPLFTAIAVALPWCLAVAAKETDFWHYFFWEEHIRRFCSKGHAQHENPFWYFIPVFIGGAIPWIFIAPMPLRDLLRRRLREPLVQFALCWLIAPFLFFSASSGKLGTYILPCFAPFSLLLAWALVDRFEEQRKQKSLQVGIILMATIVGVLLVALPIIVGLNAFQLLPPLDTHFGLKVTGLLMGCSAALAFLISAYKSEQGRRKVVRLGISAGILFISAQICAPRDISESLGIQGFLESENDRITAHTVLVANPKTVHAVCYVYKRDDVYLYQGKGELTYGLSYPDSEHRYLATTPELQELIQKRGDRRVALAIRSKPGDPDRAKLPPPNFERQWRKTWFAVYEPLTTDTPEN
ncbi:phospholipid carrier-dependent glycosyltransferase [Pontiella agarivorans]|uniref:Phospholipid carrier-dependent glycosyltransferase n=1 Tax=Pontiella agarivorans TaxID=3038953 RepID=A0ABU5N142_9BACT|nr:phospholipid carrier-dependent glycosyltransferase [Pontiella agarivorans]MDZ8120167.1 phospholipid carrier-dependent glycosyltransferase [Pontiella agarivorans]